MKFTNVSPYTLIDEGTYKITILTHEETPNTFYKEGEPDHRKMRLTWVFQMPDGVSTVKYYTGRNLGSVKANLVKLVAAVLGKNPKELTDKDKEIDTKAIIGKKVMIKIIHETDDDNQTWHKIQNVKPVGAKNSSGDLPF